MRVLALRSLSGEIDPSALGAPGQKVKEEPGQPGKGVNADEGPGTEAPATPTGNQAEAVEVESSMSLVFETSEEAHPKPPKPVETSEETHPKPVVETEHGMEAEAAEAEETKAPDEVAQAVQADEVSKATEATEAAEIAGAGAGANPDAAADPAEAKAAAAEPAPTDEAPATASERADFKQQLQRMTLKGTGGLLLGLVGDGPCRPCSLFSCCYRYCVTGSCCS